MAVIFPRKTFHTSFDEIKYELDEVEELLSRPELDSIRIYYSDGTVATLSEVSEEDGISCDLSGIVNFAKSCYKNKDWNMLTFICYLIKKITYYFTKGENSCLRLSQLFKISPENREEGIRIMYKSGLLKIRLDSSEWNMENIGYLKWVVEYCDTVKLGIDYLLEITWENLSFEEFLKETCIPVAHRNLLLSNEKMNEILAKSPCHEITFSSTLSIDSVVLYLENAGTIIPTKNGELNLRNRMAKAFCRLQKDTFEKLANLFSYSNFLFSIDNFLPYNKGMYGRIEIDLTSISPKLSNYLCSELNALAIYLQLTRSFSYTKDQLLQMLVEVGIPYEQENIVKQLLLFISPEQLKEEYNIDIDYLNEAPANMKNKFYRIKELKEFCGKMGIVPGRTKSKILQQICHFFQNKKK